MYKEKMKLFQELDLVGIKDASLILGWHKAKTSTYNNRNKLPAPIGYISGRPVWLREQIENYKIEKGIE